MANEIVQLRQGELILDAAVAERCEQRLALAQTHMAAGFYHWLEAGKQFKAIKDDLGARQWAPWLRKHEVVESTARFLVAVAERFDPILLAASRIDELNIDFRALQLLAAPSVPVAAAQAAVDRAAAGEHITRQQADALIAQARADEAAKALAEGRERTAAEVETERRRTEREIEKAAKAVETATGKQTKAELKAAELTTKLAELRASRKEEVEAARAEIARRYEGKLVLTEEELHRQVAMLMKQSDKTVECLEKQLATANARFQSAQEEVGRLRRKMAAPVSTEKPFDSNLSMKAMVVQQAISHLREELKLSAQECIAIEVEMATRIHHRPELARDKFSKMAAAIDDIIPWFEAFLSLYRQA